MRNHFHLILLLILLSCNRRAERSADKTGMAVTDTVHSEVSKYPRPVWGYRFVISGDFDGDGKKESLTEHYFSKAQNREVNKFYEGMEYDSMVDSAMKKEPYSFLLSDAPRMDTLRICKDPQLFGISFLKNEGDLDGDGADEVSYVIDWADFSNLNSWHIVSLKKGRWKEIYSFPIWDWQLPATPGAENQYGLLGTENKDIHETSDTAGTHQAEETDDFKGLVKKMGNRKIQVIFRNEEADEDTMLVVLKKSDF